MSDKENQVSNDVDKESEVDLKSLELLTGQKWEREVIEK